MATYSYSISSRKNIEANKNGQLSDTQREVLGKETQSYLKPILWVIGGGAIILLLATLFLTRGNIQVLFRVFLTMDSAIYWVIGTVSVPPIVIMLGLGYKRTQTIARDVSENNIVSANGAVVWKKDWVSGNSRYVAITDNHRRLKMLFGNLLILPGKYRFFYLGRGRWILSAEKLSGELSDLIPALAQVFNFTFEDLQANQRGVLTDRQARRLRSKMRSAIINDMLDVFIKFGIIGLGILGLFVLFFGLNFLTWLAGSLISMVALLGFSARNRFILQNPIRTDLAEKQVEFVDGVKKGSQNIEIRSESSDEKSTVKFHYIMVPKIDQRYSIGKQGRNALIRTSGIDYRVYYTPYSKSLASLEPIRVTRGKNGKDQQ